MASFATSVSFCKPSPASRPPSPVSEKFYPGASSHVPKVRLRYNTRLTDPETGHIYYRFRHYSPHLGRWLNRDPIGERGGLNLFGMVGNDPVNRLDPLGLHPFDRMTTPGGMDYLTPPPGTPGPPVESWTQHYIGDRLHENPWRVLYPWEPGFILWVCPATIICGVRDASAELPKQCREMREGIRSNAANGGTLSIADRVMIGGGYVAEATGYLGLGCAGAAAAGPAMGPVLGNPVGQAIVRTGSGALAVCKSVDIGTTLSTSEGRDNFSVTDAIDLIGLGVAATTKLGQSGPTLKFSGPPPIKTAKNAVLQGQHIVDTAVKEFVPNLKLRATPEFDPTIPPGKYGWSHPSGVSRIGPQAINEGYPETIKTILHEDIHLRWNERSVPRPHNEAKIESIVDRYFRMRGWDNE